MVPTLCTPENEGDCNCRDAHFKGFQTFTWWINSEQRCYFIHRAKDSSVQQTGKKVPVVMFLNCYSKDHVSKDVVNATADADRFGTHLVFTSTPRGAWSWHAAIENDKQPMGCDSTATGGGDDFTYFTDIFAHLPSVLPNHDPEQVFTYGFSQNGMGSGYVANCFLDKVTGAWRGGAGLFLHYGGGGPVPPHLEGSCDTCEYWPSYPCFQGVGKRPLRDCAQDYENDPITAFNATDSHPMGLYRKSLLEGRDARIVVFKPDIDHKGGHRPPDYQFDWAMGCLGLRDEAGQCSSHCVRVFKSCVAGGKNYGECLGIGQAADLHVADACHAGCTPTFEMLSQSQVPILHTTNKNGFGVPAKDVCKNARPATSICTVDPSKVKECSSSKTFVV